MQVTIISGVQVYDEQRDYYFDDEELAPFAGLGSDEIFSDYLRDGPGPENDLPVTGGVMRLEYDNERKELNCLVSYELLRPLSAGEARVLVRYTYGQLTDGIGENFICDQLDRGFSFSLVLTNPRILD